MQSRQSEEHTREGKALEAEGWEEEVSPEATTEEATAACAEAHKEAGEAAPAAEARLDPRSGRRR